MWSIPAVTAARSTPIADARSGGALTAHGPANCIAPYPDLLTRLGPSGNVDIGRAGWPGAARRAGRDSDMEFSRGSDGFCQAHARTRDQGRTHAGLLVTVRGGSYRPGTPRGLGPPNLGPAKPRS